MRDATPGFGGDGDESLWQAAQAFRLLSLVYAVGYQFAVDVDYTKPRLSWLIVGLLVCWSVASGVLYLTGHARTRWFVGAEHVVVLGLSASTLLFAPDGWFPRHQLVTTSLWSANAVVSAALLGGATLGVASGLVIGFVTAALRGSLTFNLDVDATLVILVAIGLGCGVAATSARRTYAVSTAATRVAAAATERERLAREVHDGVLQVLALIQRRGAEIGGPTGELATLAGEQESRLRALISRQAEPDPTDATDLGRLLRARAGGAVTVSTPAGRTDVPDDVARALDGAAGAAIANAARHAGPDAQVFVLLEDLPDAVIVSVRDDGVGIGDGRLEAAEAEGRMGVTRSIRGRLTDVGGRAELFTAPGSGVEWEFTVPRSSRRSRTDRTGESR